jgi:hypothetical protein
MDSKHPPIDIIGNDQCCTCSLNLSIPSLLKPQHDFQLSDHCRQEGLIEPKLEFKAVAMPRFGPGCSFQMNVS